MIKSYNNFLGSLISNKINGHQCSPTQYPHRAYINDYHRNNDPFLVTNLLSRVRLQSYLIRNRIFVLFVLFRGN